MSQVVAAVYRHWKPKGPIIYHAIAHVLTGQNDTDRFSVGKGAGRWHRSRS